MFLVIGGLSMMSHHYTLGNIKSRTVGDGQHGTARWATDKEIKQTYAHVPFKVREWRRGQNLPTEQGLILGCKGQPQELTALVDSDDIHCLMIGASGIGKTAFFLYPNLEYACASGMSWLALDSKGDLARNYGTIAKNCYGYNVSVIDLRNPTRSDGNNLLTLVNRYMDITRKDPKNLAARAKAEKYAKILAKTIVNPDGDDSNRGQNAFFYDAAEGLLTSVILMLAAVITAVDEYQALLRITVATAGNDHRLGASEAPPAILSIFLGEALQNTLMQAACGEGSTAAARRELEMRVPVMPHLRQDDSDRNRTSPFAFTGNKFEFRMLGSSQSISDPNTVLNTAVAEVLGRYADRLEQSADREDTVRTLLQETLEQHGRILFNGDGYSEEWQQEAERRGLLNLRTAPEAFAHLTEEKNVALFAKHGIFTAAELTSRQEIHYETYAKCIRIEAATMAEMVRRQILPAGQAALRELGQTSRAKQEISPLLSCKAEELLGTQIANYNDMLLAGCTLLENLLRDFPSGTEEQKALYARDRLLPAMNELRQAADALEQMCPAHLWPMPTYGELLYGV